MYNPYQPFINLINSNLSVLNRFANSRDITGLVQDSVNRTLRVSQEAAAKAAQTGAFEELTRGLADNVARFTQEYVNGISQSVALTQNVLSRQAEFGNRQLENFKDAAEAVDDAADDAAQEGQLRLAKTGSERERHARNAKQ